MPGARAAARGRPAEIAVQNAGLLRLEDGGEALAAWLSGVLASAAPEAASLGLRFARRPEMKRLNRRFRGGHGATDVLSFPGFDSPEGAHLGDIVICPAIARRQARHAGHPFERELRLLALHGVLHCLGYDHERDDGEMEAVEGRWRARWLDG